MKTKILLSITMLALIFNSCSDKEQTKTITGQDGKSYTVINENISPFYDFGNGVYYFDLRATDTNPEVVNTFGKAISEFIKLHKDVRISTIASHTAGSSTNHMCGYWIITEPKVTCPCDSVKQTKN